MYVCDQERASFMQHMSGLEQGLERLAELLGDERISTLQALGHVAVRPHAEYVKGAVTTAFLIMVVM